MAIVMKKGKAGKPSSSHRASPAAPAVSPEELRNRIAQRAYELWDARGRRQGCALEDWLDAERMVMSECHEARE